MIDRALVCASQNLTLSRPLDQLGLDAALGDLSMGWLKPFMDKRGYKKGDVLFRKGQRAHEMFLASPENSTSSN